jgi:hypothetical protein
VTVTTAAWPALAAIVLAAAFVATQHTPWLRVDDRAGTWVLRRLAGIRTPWQLADRPLLLENELSGCAGGGATGRSRRWAIRASSDALCENRRLRYRSGGDTG